MALLSTDPVDLLLDDTNDIVITSDLQFSSGIQGVLQACRIALQMFAGEWFLNLDAGIPYWQQILAQKPAIALKAARIAFRDALENVPGVDAVQSLNVSFDGATRAMTVTFTVTTLFGDATQPPISIGAGGS